jgi:imidazolonepropionase-like amidohydrolase
VRLTVDGASSERTLDVRMDPRVSLSDDDLKAQTDLSMASYRGHIRAQEMRDAIDSALERSGAGAGRRASLQALRGEGSPGDPDIMYGSIYATPDSTETVVGLQEKFLHLLNLLQAADAKPTAQAREAVAALERTLTALEKRWAALR